MDFFDFFKHKKNVVLIIAVAAIVLGALTLILSTPFAFGPWITPAVVEASDSERFLALISIMGIVIALAEIILGVVLCIKTQREKMSVLMPLFIILSCELFMVFISLIIFGFAEISVFFYVIGLLLLLGMLTGFIFIFFFMKEYTPETAEAARAAKEAKARAKAEEKAARELKEEEEHEKATRALAALEAMTSAPPEIEPAPPYSTSYDSTPTAPTPEV